MITGFQYTLIVSIFAATLCFHPTEALAEQTTTGPSDPLVIALPDGVPVVFPVQDIRTGRQEMRFVTASLDGSSTDIGGDEFILRADVMFAYNKANLTTKAKTMLTEVASRVRNAQAMAISVTGHTDSAGSLNYNLALSKKRAVATKNYLRSKLGPSVKIKAIGKGENQPRASNSTKIGRSANRRVEIILDK